MNKIVIFHYIGFTSSGAKKHGVIEAVGETAALQQLKSEGLRIFRLSEQNGHRSTRSFFKKLLAAKPDLQRFFADIAMLMEAGLGLDRALRVIAVDLVSDAHQQLAAELLERLSSGRAPSQAFRIIGEEADKFSALIASGEQTGKLATVFRAIATDMENRRKRRRQISNAIVYPAFLTLMMGIALLVVTFFLVPAILPIFEGAGKQAPMIMRALDILRVTIIEWGLLMAFFGITISILSILGAGRKRVKTTLSGLMLLVPGISEILRKHGLARYLQSLSMLLGNGVGMSKALALAAAACPIESYTAKLTIAHDEVISGRRLPEALATTAIFPPSILSLIAIGDDINDLPSVLSRSAELLDLEALRIQERLLALMTPTITILMGGLVGGLVISVMSALLSINELSVQ